MTTNDDSVTSTNGANAASGAAARAQNAARDAARDARGDLHGAIDKAAEKAQPLADRLASSAHAGVDRVGDGLNAASQQLTERSRQMGDAYQRFADSSRVQVRNSPLTSLLVAAAAGYALSKLFGTRR